MLRDCGTGELVTLTGAGQMVEIVLAGGAGYGPPEERDPGALARDLALGFVTPGHADDDRSCRPARRGRTREVNHNDKSQRQSDRQGVPAMTDTLFHLSRRGLLAMAGAGLAAAQLPQPSLRPVGQDADHRLGPGHPELRPAYRVRLFRRRS